jgi:hypothetical protein
VLCPAFVPCSFIIHFKGSVTTRLKQSEVVSGSVWPPKCTKSFGGRAAGAKEGPGFQLSRKSDPIIRAQFDSRMHQNSPTSICIFKNFPGLYTRTPTKGGGGEGRGGEGKGRGGMGRGPGTVPVWANRIMVTLITLQLFLTSLKFEFELSL